ncbi:MAG TPA: GNAT family N-acetyltransferase [Solirubrobacterales bacterium]
MNGSAELIADRGEAAAGEEFFRSRPFLDAEGVTHTLRIDAGERRLVTPLVVREIPGSDRLDATSPYGYPGLVSDLDRTGDGSISDPPPLDPASIDFAPTGLVAIFLRHTLGEPPLGAASERNIVQIADPAEPAKSRSSDRNQVNRNRRQGYEVRIVPGPETAPEDRAGFLAAYEQTMLRANADRRYFFGAAYFDRILAADRAWLALAAAPDGSIAAGSVTVESDGFLHYYLSGSTDANLRDSPMKNVVAALVELAGERELPLNLGGGITRGDRLEEFKRGFANREQPWHSSEIVCDPRAYADLSGGRGGGRFFPAYRAPR